MQCLLTLSVFVLTLRAAQSVVYIDEDCYIFPVYPVQYEITLTPYMTGGQFYYEGEITIVVISTVNGQMTIELDARDLEIHSGSVSVFFDNRNIVDERRPFLLDKRRGKVIIYLREGLRTYESFKGKPTVGRKNQYYIKMRFRGNINRGDSGLFATSYREGKSLKWLLSTRLAPHYASSVFPCFDNPRMEAGYIIRIFRPEQFTTALSVSREIKRQNTLVEFAPSPQIPSYKFGIHLSEFVPHQASASPGQANYLVVWTRREETRHHYFTLAFGNKVLTAFNLYMNWTRPITSGPINVVAIPNYWRGYEKSAWNLLTVGEHKFLIQDDQVSALQKEQIEFELARQLSRVWLGNPDEVSKTRWKQEWYKEGMATYYGYHFLVWGDMYQRGPDVLGLQAMFGAMGVDSKSKVYLSSFNITSADVLTREEEDLVTLKTASIIRMIEYWLGSESFHKIVRGFLAVSHGKTVTIQDFGDYLQQMAVHCEFFKGYTVSNIIGSWIDQPGYPVINVKVYKDRPVVTLSQHHFYLDYRSEPIKSNFLIPISYTTQVPNNCINCLQPRFIISGSDYTFQENLNGGWIILNRKASGYYRVNYDLDNWQRIIQTLNSGERNNIDVTNRAQIVNDAFALYGAGLIDLGLAERILGSLELEEELPVWDAAFQGFDLLKKSRKMTKQLYEHWKSFMAQQVSKIYLKVKSPSQQDYQWRIFKSKVVEFACAVELSACIGDIAHLRLEKGQVYDPDLRKAYYYVKLKRADFWPEVERHSQTCGVYEREDIESAKRLADYERKYFDNLRMAPEEIRMTTVPPSTPCCLQSPVTGASASAASTHTYFLGLVAILKTLHLIL